jgi:hypothetical protein
MPGPGKPWRAMFSVNSRSSDIHHLPVDPSARRSPSRRSSSGADARNRVGVNGRTVRDNQNPPHAMRLALGSVSLDVLAQSLGKVNRVIGAYTY